ncbi:MULTISPECIES: type IV pilin protein [Burkholderiaceae]|uniref:Type IV pilus biogenesis protein PilE n=1 Tax=Caballeronia sordidicola TaxID=196367 RepID=A0A242N988_CABSO|nr:MULTISPECIES: type IV pilin protein [Burkholderiaceae]OTP80152.1 Type IV pilus biogenesis protein PilE [Caballeronia sordidicola]
MNTTAHTSSGFSLLELMITLGVAAIIAVFAMPVYQQQVLKGHRLDAVAAIYRAAQYMESARTLSGSDTALKLPAGFDQTPTTGAPIYVLRILAESEMNGGYSIEAEPVSVTNDAYGIFALDATGVKSNRALEKLTPPKVAACWSGK